ncbi:MULTISPECIES: hypothetical protein [unclassified Meiothermus]|uniref:hypothetical protein n=1 Tax=unclassified Meiothermus TaxID=370471 RepID=UPI000D7C7170|nr:MULTISPECIES: hypothetical protein [unclassified Meiothermus]PZA08507.1 hypothetical protein DNA98_00180 [Meiothermus sp. Pnk-1]RYM36888.1 hypothetical protein EWH23_08090 [Meiothermus sp. PNK-Is4]
MKRSLWITTIAGLLTLGAVHAQSASGVALDQGIVTENPLTELQQWVSAMPASLDLQALSPQQLRQLYALLRELYTASSPISSVEAQQILEAIASTLPAPALEQLQAQAKNMTPSDYSDGLKAALNELEDTVSAVGFDLGN